STILAAGACHRKRGGDGGGSYRRCSTSPNSTGKPLLQPLEDSPAAAKPYPTPVWVPTMVRVGAAFIDKDAPLEDEKIEVAEDDAYLVKQIGQSFQYSKIESVLFLVNIHASSMYGRLNIDRIHFLIKARREEQIQAAHDEAMFGALALPPPTSTDSEPEKENEKEVDKKSCCYKPL
ncbi:hypothetical protein S245_048538, partial [Arachis hypogaea]